MIAGRAPAGRAGCRDPSSLTGSRHRSLRSRARPASLVRDRPAGVRVRSALGDAGVGELVVPAALERVAADGDRDGDDRGNELESEQQGARISSGSAPTMPRAAQALRLKASSIVGLPPEAPCTRSFMICLPNVLAPAATPGRRSRRGRGCRRRLPDRSVAGGADDRDHGCRTGCRRSGGRGTASEAARLGAGDRGGAAGADRVGPPRRTASGRRRAGCRRTGRPEEVAAMRRGSAAAGAARTAPSRMGSGAAEEYCHRPRVFRTGEAGSRSWLRRLDQMRGPAQRGSCDGSAALRG